jgi:hypothetical protein
VVHRHATNELTSIMMHYSQYMWTFPTCFIAQKDLHYTA